MRLALWCGLCWLWAAPLHAQLSAPLHAAQVREGAVQGATEVSGDADPSPLDQFWLGAYFRHLWIPSYITEPFFDRAPSITNNGFGLVATYRSGGGLNIQFGVGYMPYHFSGTFLADGQPIEDTEIVESDVDFLHLTGSMLWDIEFGPAVALELGFGLDLGVLIGDLKRDEGYLDPNTGEFERCDGPLMPPTLGPDDRPYCDEPENGSGVTDDQGEEGEHYGIVDDRVPPIMAFPMVPHVALRLQPFDHLMLKLEAAFGIAQLWVGASLHVSFGVFKSGPQETLVEPDAAAVPPPVLGRVLGRVVEAETDAPIAGATVALANRALSPLSTSEYGRFVVDRLDPGAVTFNVQHPDYQPGTCSVEVAPEGGDSALICHLTPLQKVGAISGQVRNQRGDPISTQVVLSGPREATLATDAQGAFAAPDLPVGAYRLRVDAEGYLLQVVEVEIEQHATATPQVVLVEKPKKSLVVLKSEEIAISQQVQFESGSATIAGESDALLLEIADVVLRNAHLELVEIQGHTDSRGGRELNMKLSQERADAVRDRLITLGVEAARMRAVGYGPDHPIRTNSTADGRAKNRRVQFIIRQQTAVEQPAP